MLEANRLHQNIPNRRRLHRTGNDFAASRLGRELVEQMVSRATTDNMDHGQTFAGKLTQFFRSPAVLQREAFENTAHYLGICLGDRLICFCAKALKTLHHVPGARKRSSPTKTNDLRGDTSAARFVRSSYA